MKLRLFVALTVLVALAGCSVPSVEFAQALANSWKQIKPYAEKGVREDQSLDAAQKDVRLQLIAEFDETLKEGADAN